MASHMSRSHVEEWMVLARAQIVLRIINTFLALGIIVVMALMYGLPGLFNALIPAEKISGLIYGVLLFLTSILPLALFSRYTPKSRSGIPLLVTLMDSFLLVFGAAIAVVLILFYPMYNIIAVTFALYVLSVSVTAAHVGLDIRQMIMVKDS